MSLSFRFYTFNNYYDFFSLKWEEKKKKIDELFRVSWQSFAFFQFKMGQI